MLLTMTMEVCCFHVLSYSFNTLVWACQEEYIECTNFSSVPPSSEVLCVRPCKTIPEGEQISVYIIAPFSEE